MKRFMAGHFKEGWFVACVEIEKYNASIVVKEGLTEKEAKNLEDRLNMLVEQ